MVSFFRKKIFIKGLTTLLVICSKSIAGHCGFKEMDNCGVVPGLSATTVLKKPFLQKAELSKVFIIYLLQKQKIQRQGWL